MSATIKDLAVFLGHKTAPGVLSKSAVEDLESAQARLAMTHPEALLDLMLEFQKSGLHPRRPAIERPAQQEKEDRPRRFGVLRR